MTAKLKTGDEMCNKDERFIVQKKGMKTRTKPYWCENFGCFATLEEAQAHAALLAELGAYTDRWRIIHRIDSNVFAIERSTCQSPNSK